MCTLAELYTCAQTHPLIFGLTNKRSKIQMSRSQEKLLHWRQMADQEVNTQIISHIYFHCLVNTSLCKLDLNISTLKWKCIDLYHTRSNEWSIPSFQSMILLTLLKKKFEKVQFLWKHLILEINEISYECIFLNIMSIWLVSG